MQQFFPEFHRIYAREACGQFRLLSSWQKKNESPYEILSVNRHATAKEIKLAYFREAKKHHPDLNPNDTKAKERFQKVAAAYEILSDESKRKTYDTTGSTGNNSYGGAGGNNQYGAEYSSKQAEDIFNTVKEDIDVVTDAFQSYTAEIKDEVMHAVECVKIRDWKGLYEVANENKTVIFGVVVPTMLFLRYPPAAMAILRLSWVGMQGAIGLLTYTGNLNVAAQMLWNRVVRLSLAQKKRVQERDQAARDYSSQSSSSSSSGSGSGSSGPHSSSSRSTDEQESGTETAGKWEEEGSRNRQDTEKGTKTKSGSSSYSNTWKYRKKN